MRKSLKQISRLFREDLDSELSMFVCHAQTPTPVFYNYVDEFWLLVFSSSTKFWIFFFCFLLDLFDIRIFCLFLDLVSIFSSFSFLLKVTRVTTNHPINVVI